MALEKVVTDIASNSNMPKELIQQVTDQTNVLMGGIKQVVEAFSRPGPTTTAQSPPAAQEPPPHRRRLGHKQNVEWSAATQTEEENHSEARNLEAAMGAAGEDTL